MRIVFSILVSAFVFYLLLGIAGAEEVSRAEVATDCRAEGMAMDVAESDLKEYVKECIEEFIGSKMENHQRAK